MLSGCTRFKYTKEGGEKKVREKRKPVQARFSPEVSAKIKELAEKEKRSMSQMLDVLVGEALAAREEKEAKNEA